MGMNLWSAVFRERTRDSQIRLAVVRNIDDIHGLV